MYFSLSLPHDCIMWYIFKTNRFSDSESHQNDEKRFCLWSFITLSSRKFR